LNGSHRRDGLFVLAGPGVTPAGALPGADIVDVLPTLLPLTGLPIPLGLDGAPIPGVLDRPPQWGPDLLPESTAIPTPYGEAESHEIAARLRSLGYLESAQ
jgi:hypothetical protein